MAGNSGLGTKPVTTRTASPALAKKSSWHWPGLNSGNENLGDAGRALALEIKTFLTLVECSATGTETVATLPGCSTVGANAFVALGGPETLGPETSATLAGGSPPETKAVIKLMRI